MRRDQKSKMRAHLVEVLSSFDNEDKYTVASSRRGSTVASTRRGGGYDMLSRRSNRVKPITHSHEYDSECMLCKLERIEKQRDAYYSSPISNRKPLSSKGRREIRKQFSSDESEDLEDDYEEISEASDIDESSDDDDITTKKKKKKKKGDDIDESSDDDDIITKKKKKKKKTKPWKLNFSNIACGGVCGLDEKENKKKKKKKKKKNENSSKQKTLEDRHDHRTDDRCSSPLHNVKRERKSHRSQSVPSRGRMRDQSLFVFSDDSLLSDNDYSTHQDLDSYAV